MIDGLKLPEAWHAHYLFQLLEEDHYPSELSVSFLGFLRTAGEI
jgi:hypothetical protein